MMPSPSSLQVPMWPVAGERCGRRQPGESSDWPAGLTWCRGGGWQVDGDASRVGVPLAEHADGVGIAGRPKQYVLTNAAFLRTMADLLVVDGAAVADFVSWATFLFSRRPCLRVVVFVRIPLLTPLYLSCQECSRLRCMRTCGRQQTTLLNTSTNPNRRYVAEMHRQRHATEWWKCLMLLLLFPACFTTAAALTGPSIVSCAPDCFSHRGYELKALKRLDGLRLCILKRPAVYCKKNVFLAHRL